MPLFRQDTFGYDSTYWSDKISYNEDGGRTGFDNQETKLPTYWSTPFSRLCLGMKVRGQLKFIAIDWLAPSLHSLIADGQYRATSLYRLRWKSLIEGSSLQRNCNKEGFNTFGEGDRPNYFARIGIIGNEKYDCQIPDSVIGFGTKTSNLDCSCGNVARWGGDGGNMDAPAMGYIFAGRKKFSCFYVFLSWIPVVYS